MYHIYLVNNTVQEIIPDANPAFPDIPIEQRYATEFLVHCITADDVSAIHTGMIYDLNTKTFSEPPVVETPEEEPTGTLTPAQRREAAYESVKSIIFQDESLTVDEANQKYLDYLAEGNTETCAALQTLIAAAKESIRTQYPDTTGTTT